MRFRLRAFAVHLLVSAGVLTGVLGTLYFGWYRWPGWYLAGAPAVVAALIAVDVTIGPLMTLVIARSTKPRRVLVRDIALIAAVQLSALAYGTAALWHGRPLYYAFSEDVLQLVQAYDISGRELTIARDHHAPILPHWYSLPRWIWAPLPQDPDERKRIVMSAFAGGDDVISMPRYFRQWEQGLPALRKQLRRVDDVAYFSRGQKASLKERMRSHGFDTEQPNAMPLTGRDMPLLAVFDPSTLKILGILAPSRSRSPGSAHRLELRRYLRTLVAGTAASH